MLQLFCRQKRKANRDKLRKHLESSTADVDTAPLDKLCSKLKWSDVLARIEGLPDTEETAKTSAYRLLHVLCRYHPPVEVIEAALDKFPWAVALRDEDAHYPLHIAVSSGADPAVIELLLIKFPKAVRTLDKNGRSVLFLLCKYYRKNYRQTLFMPEMHLEPALRQTTKMIVKRFPSAVNIDDKHGESPIEVAIDSGFSMETIKFIQYASYKSWIAVKRNKQSEQETNTEVTHRSSSFP